MMVDWSALLVRLRANPYHFHHILQPCPVERIEAVEREFGGMPASLKKMLSHFNGAELFLCPSPSFTLFGISLVPPLPSLEWAPDWYIDKFTATWRAAASNHRGAWAIAMTNYGGLILLDEHESIREWDGAQSTWLMQDLPFEEWIEKMVSEGGVIMGEAGPSEGVGAG